MEYKSALPSEVKYKSVRNPEIPCVNPKEMSTHIHQKIYIL